MKKEDWDRIDETVDQALQYHGKTREQFIRQKCGDDSELMKEVTELIKHMDIAASENFLDLSDEKRNNLYKEIGNSRDENQIRQIIRREKIGVYEITDVIGRGGMGVVYKARRADGAFDREVAIKIVRFGMETEENIRRFNNERKVLASLHHPNIARLLDGGVTEDGLPYLIMDIVDGKPIDVYCRDNNTSLSQKLALFKQVCQAVQFAHTNLIIHRDIKPNNIFVTENGEVKVLDFGIAKLIEEDPENDHITQTGRILMTPEYAAPEQFRKSNINTSVDIYSLGILLYELLTGSNLFDFNGKSITEIERMVCHIDPHKPSENLSISGQISPDLDVICMKALRKDPADRYATVHELLDDILRFQNGMPISARPATLVYRIRKFASRHRPGIAVAIIFFLMMATFILILARQQTVTAQERDRAITEARKAEQISGFLIEMFEMADPAANQGETITAIDMLNRGIERAERLSDQPEIHMEVLNTAGQIYLSMRQPDKARPVFEEALLLSQSFYGPVHTFVADVKNSLGHAFRLSEDYETAEEYYLKALDQRLQLFGDEHADIACSLNNLGLIAHNRNNFEVAEQYYLQALDSRGGFVERTNPCIATILSNLGIINRRTGEFEVALEYHREALEIRKSLYGDFHPDVALSLNQKGILFRQLGMVKEAEIAYREAIEINKKILGEGHYTVASNMNNLGVLLWSQGEFSQAEEIHREVLEMRTHLFGRHHTAVASSIDHLGAVLRDKGEHTEAIQLLEMALDMRRDLLGENHPTYAVTLVNLAMLLQLQGNHSAAEELLFQALEIRQDILPEGHWQIAVVKSLLGVSLAARGEKDQAGILITEGYRELTAQFGTDNSYTKQAELRLAEFLSE